MNTANNLPSVGDWIAVDNEGHTGKVIVTKEEIVNGRRLGHSLFIGVNDQGVEEIDLPYYTRVTPKSVESTFNLAGVSSQFHTVFVVHSYDLIDDEGPDAMLRIGANIPIHENGRTAPILNIMGNNLFVAAGIGELSARLHDAAQYIKDESLATQYEARIPVSIYNAWYNDFFTFRIGMRIRVGYSEFDVAEIVNVHAISNYEVEITAGVLNGSVAPMLLWRANNWDEKRKLISIRARALDEWLQSTAPDILPEFEKPMSFIEYSKHVRISGKYSASSRLAGIVTRLCNVAETTEELIECKRYVCDALYTLAQLAKAHGFDLQDIATHSLADRDK